MPETYQSSALKFRRLSMIGGFSVTTVAFSDALFKPSSRFIAADSLGNIALIRSKEQALCKHARDISCKVAE